MEAEDPLKDLADIHLPDPVSLWPPAPGWWVLGVVLLAILVYAVLCLIAHWRQQKRLRAALRELDGAHRTYHDARAQGADANACGLAYLQDCNTVLKRVALLHSPTDAVARLYGEAWLQFLDAQGDTQEFSRGAGRILGDGGYRPTFDGDVDAIHALCAEWIRHVYQEEERRRAAVRAQRIPGLRRLRPLRQEQVEA